MPDVMPATAHLRDHAGGDAGRSVVRIVEDLDLETTPRVVEGARGPDQALDDVALVVDRQLDRDRGKGIQPAGPAPGAVAMSQVEMEKIRPVAAVDRQDGQDREIERDDADLDRTHLRGRTPTPRSIDGR